MSSNGRSPKGAFQFCGCILFGICGVALICLWPVLLDNLLVLKPNSPLYNYWKKLPFNIPTDLYFFNWTNSEDVNNASVKPKFQEVGPYRFWQTEEKCNITWNANGTVTYKQQKFWFYDHKEENGNLDDVVITVNPVATAAAYVARNWNYYVRKSIFGVLSKTGYFTSTVTQNVGNLFFDGYKEPLIKIAAAMPFFGHLGIPKWDKFGYLYDRNGSIDNDGTFEMGTGINSTLGKLYSWNHQTRTPYFDGVCGDVEGSSGELYMRNLKKDWVSIFWIDVRKSVKLKFVGEETVRGILGYKYILEYYALDNGTLYPETKCNCIDGCVPTGLLNTSKAQFGSPLFSSLPHFYKADPYYTRLIDGMKPNASKHEFLVIAEPITGIPLKVHGVLQLNLLIQSIPGSQLFDSVPTFFLPVAWFDQQFDISRFDAFLVKLLINISTICISVGSMMIVFSFVLLFLTIYNSVPGTPKIPPREQTFQEQYVPLRKPK